MSRNISGIEVPDANPDAVITGIDTNSNAYTAMARINHFFFYTFGLDESGNIAVPNDPFLRDVMIVAKQLDSVMTSLSVINSDALSPCDHEPKYAGGVETPGNKKYTPREMATNALKRFSEIERDFKNQ